MATFEATEPVVKRMSANKLYLEVTKVWDDLSPNSTDNPLRFNPETPEKFFNAFHVGNHYFYVFNVNEIRFEYIHPKIYDLTGYEASTVDVPFFFSHIHPEDQPWFLAFETKVVEFFSQLKPEQFLNYKVSYDYRVMTANNSYIRILQQVVTLEHDNNGHINHTLGVHTDISHIKSAESYIKPSLSFIGLNGEPSYYNIDVQAISLREDSEIERISIREREVLNLLINGLSSQEIANKLFISKQTVDSHRKNLLRKLKADNTAELVSIAIRMGWV